MRTAKTEPAHHPFGELVGLHVEHQAAGESTLTLSITERHLNPHRVVHGAVLYALADTGMGAALYPTLTPGETWGLTPRSSRRHGPCSWQPPS